MPCVCGETECPCRQICVCRYKICSCMTCATIRVNLIESGNFRGSGGKTNVNLKKGKTSGKLPVRTDSSQAAASSPSKRLPLGSKSKSAEHPPTRGGTSSLKPDKMKRKLGSTSSMDISKSPSDDDPHATLKRKLSEPCKFPVSENLSEFNRLLFSRIGGNLGESSLSNVNNNQPLRTQNIVTGHRQVESGASSLLHIRRNLSSNDMKASESTSNIDPHATIKRQLSEPSKFSIDENLFSGLYRPASNASTLNSGESSSKEDISRATSFPSNETDSSAANFEHLKICSDRAIPSFKAFESQLRTPSTNKDRNENFGSQTSRSQVQNKSLVPGNQSSLDPQSRIALSTSRELYLPHPSSSTVSEPGPLQPSHQEHPLNLTKASTDNKHEESALRCSSFLPQNRKQIPVQHPMDFTESSNTLTKESVEPASSARDGNHPITPRLLSSDSSAGISHSGVSTESVTSAIQSSAASTSREPNITSIRCSVIKGPYSLPSHTSSSNICTTPRGVNEGGNVPKEAPIQDFFNPMQPTTSSAYHETNPPNTTLSSLECPHESSSFFSSATTSSASYEIQNPNQAPMTPSAFYGFPEYVIPEPAIPPSTETGSPVRASQDPTPLESSTLRSAFEVHRAIDSDFGMMEDSSTPAPTESPAFFFISQDPGGNVQPSGSYRAEDESAGRRSPSSDERMETD